MLDTFTIDAATALVGTKFRVTGNGVDLEMTLTDALPFEIRERRTKPKFMPRRKPFSLYFSGPPSPILPQSMYRFESERVAFDDLFIVPIGADAESAEYEAVFT